jgi:hypothetical protein
MENIPEKQLSQTKEKFQKPIYKVWWFWVFVVFIIIVIASSGGEKKENIPQTTSPVQKEITQPPQEEVQVQQEVVQQQPQEKTQTIILLSSEGELTPIIIDISPKEFDQKSSEFIFKRDLEGLTNFTKRYSRDIPNNTKALLLGEEMALEPDLMKRRDTAEFFVKIKILEGSYKDTIGWANRSHIKILGSSEVPSQNESKKEEWKTITTYQGTGSKNLGIFAVPKKQWRFKISWGKLPTDIPDTWGIWEYGQDPENPQYTISYILVPAGQSTAMPTFSLPHPSLRVEIDKSISWIIEVQEYTLLP